MAARLHRPSEGRIWTGSCFRRRAPEGDGEELLLDSDDVLTTPVGSAPIAPPADEDETAEVASTEEKPKVRETGTLFERMSNIARGAAQAQVDDEDSVPNYRREPIDIPRFLNRQNNQ